MSQNAMPPDSRALPPEFYDPAFYAQWPAIEGVWLFGSRSVGRATRRSDFDFGLLTKKGAFPATDGGAQMVAALFVIDVVNVFSRHLHTDDVDIVLLRMSEDPYIRFEVVSGISLFKGNLEEVASFVSLVAREYESAVALADCGLRWYREVTR